MRRLLALLLVVTGAFGVSGAPASDRGATVDPAIVSVFPVQQPRGVLATSGGWAYCEQVKALARRFHYTLACGRYYKDGYTGYGLRAERRVDWGDPAYLASFARKVVALHRRFHGDLVLLGVSYSGYGVATLASHHPELRPNRVIVVDSYLDLAARRTAAGSTSTGREIDEVTGGSEETLAAWSVSVPGLAKLVRNGTQLITIWSVAPGEQGEFNGATCDRDANAETLANLATTLGRPVTAWVTQSRHGHDLWDSGRRIMNGRPPGKKITFVPGGGIPAGSTCA